ncbi:MAG TPA: tetratricopeptide repeat protein [Gemmatimonadaceae bacterium]|nr:tetratricopeptide repeat protein [Gemmatimonadaceae bacterium]
MPTPFLSSEEYDERAHALYNEGRYDEALVTLREGLALYPNAVELHVGVGYARLAREEYAWARRSFEEALVLEPEHEDGLAGLGETLLKFGQIDAALRCFQRTLELGYTDDVDLMLQIGRTLFREGSLRDERTLFAESQTFFEVAAEQSSDSAEAVACIGYALHRLGDDDAAVRRLRQALQLDKEHAEARIYLANILYDRSEYEAALYHFERTGPDDHWDELGIWRLIELKRSLHKLDEGDPELKPWDDRLTELSGALDDVDELLMELDPTRDTHGREAEHARGQLELFGTLLSEVLEQKADEETFSAEFTLPAEAEADAGATAHRVHTPDGRTYAGSWEEIVRGMRDADHGFRGRSLEEYMHRTATRYYSETGVRVPSHDPESFLRGIAIAGFLQIEK